MSNEQALTKLNERLRPLWLFLTGGAFVSFAGTALTLFYFWGIGGIPIGQVASAGAMAKVVLSSASFFAVVFLMAWLAPTLLSQTVTDDSPIALVMRELFSKPTEDSLSRTNRFNSDEGADRIRSHRTELTALISDAPANDRLIPSSLGTVSWVRILFFSSSTVGMGCIGLICLALGVGREKGGDSFWLPLFYCLALPGMATGLLLTIQWRRFNRANVDVRSLTEGTMSAHRKDWAWLAWAAFGYGSAFLSLFPLLTLLLVFIRTEFLLEQDSYFVFILGASLISLGIVAAYSLSLAVLVRRRQGISVRWAAVLGLNALVLFGVVIALGLSTRILEAVMVMSSVRVENAVLLLEPEGCDLLQSMGIEGWGRLKGSSDKTCLLYDVTIQSTLEPSMQLACWRGIVSKSDQVAARPESVAAVAKPSASTPMAGPAASPASASAVAPPSMPAPQAPVQEAVLLGRKGSFTIPTKLVRSVWKTGGVRLEGQLPVCPRSLKILKGEVQVTASSEQASTSASISTK